MFYNATLGFIKTSALSLYLRLTPNANFRRVALTMMAIIASQATANVFTCIFQCSPVTFVWGQVIPGMHGRCININAFYLANAALNILTDFMTYTLPMPMLWKLQLPKRQKIGLITILGLGGLCVFFSILLWVQKLNYLTSYHSACLSSIIRITYVAPMLTDPDQTCKMISPEGQTLYRAKLNIHFLICRGYRGANVLECHRNQHRNSSSLHPLVQNSCQGVLPTPAR